MSNLEVYNLQGKKVSDHKAVEGLVDGPVRKTLLWEMIRMQQANRRAGTASTKTRGLVQGSTRKIYRQKGTGNARHGDIKAPIFVGGGQTFGPLPRSYYYRLPRKARQNALKSALALRYKEGKIKIVNEFNLSEIKTQKALEAFKNLGVENALLVIEAANPVVEKSVRNLPRYKVIRVEGVNVFDVLKYDELVLTEQALKKIEEKLQ